MGSVSAGAVDQLEQRSFAIGLIRSGRNIVSHQKTVSLLSIKKVQVKDMSCWGNTKKASKLPARALVQDTIQAGKMSITTRFVQ